MAYLLNLRVIACLALVAVLAFTHFTAYRKGAANVRLEWQAAIAAANNEARALEQRRQSRADEAGRLAAAREARLRSDAAGASDAVRRLRDQLARLDTGGNSGTAADAAVRALGDILNSCAAEYQRVAEEADRAFSEVKMLRDAWPR